MFNHHRYQVIAIHRSRMELLLLVPFEYKDDIEDVLKKNNISFPKIDNIVLSLHYQILVDPSLYRILNNAMQTMPGARIEIVNQIVTKQGDVDLEVELGHKVNVIIPITNDAIDSHTDQLMSKIHISGEDEDGKVEVSRRKTEKKNKKKNRKMRRREADYGSKASSQDLFVNIEENPGQGESTLQLPCEKENSKISDQSSRKSCNTCGGSFDTTSDFREHFKSDWHRFNQKLKMKGCMPVSEKEFLMCDSDTFFSDIDVL